MVFWRDTGTKDEDEEVEARDGAWSMETAMVEDGCRKEGRRGSWCCSGTRLHKQ